MRAYSVTEFRENLATVLDRADDEVIIILRNGKEYEVRARPPVKRSGLDVPGITLKNPATTESILEDIEAGRERR